MISRNQEFRIGLSYDDVLLVPQRTSVSSRRQVDLSSEVLPGIRLRVPVLSANTPWCTQSKMAEAMAKAGGLGIIHRMQTAEQQAAEVQTVKKIKVSLDDDLQSTCDRQGHLQVGAAVGVKNDYLQRAELLVAAGVDLLVLDIAHGHADYAIQAIEQIKRNYPKVHLVAGNVATAGGTRDLISAGADAIKVGIGPGGVCTTRIVTGCGVPQLTAILDCVDEARKSNIPVIADGGIRTSGDVTKALAAGASSVMLGTMLAGTHESAAILVENNGQKFKVTDGFITLGMDLTLKKCNGHAIAEEELEEYVPEGAETTFEYLGPAESVLKRIAGGVRSGFSYCGAANINELRQKAEFIRISPAGYAEGKPHAKEKAPQLILDYKTIATSDRSVREHLNSEGLIHMR